MVAPPSPMWAKGAQHGEYDSRTVGYLPMIRIKMIENSNRTVKEMPMMTGL